MKEHKHQVNIKNKQFKSLFGQKSIKVPVADTFNEPPSQIPDDPNIVVPRSPSG